LQEKFGVRAVYVDELVHCYCS